MTSELQKPEMMDLRSLDISAENRARLKRLFPSVFTEVKDEDGNFVESIDFEKLKAELGEFSDLFEGRRERYGMDWPGKKDCLRIIQQPSIGTLKPCREESIDFDATENLFIEGDNLEVLKLLQKSYYGKVKMIYIDPPYNTGKEFIYPDDYTESLETYLSYAGLLDDEGRKFSTNTPNEGRFHTKWLNMMYPRLYLARNLLREDGIIFISIDDNEVTNLHHLLNDVFGEENLVNILVWKKRYNAAKERHLAIVHEYILIYAKNKELVTNFTVPGSKDYYDNYFTETDEFFNIRGKFMTQPLEAGKSMDDRPNLRFPIESPDGTDIWPQRQWIWATERMENAKKEGYLKFYQNDSGEWKVRYKYYMKDETGNLRRVKPFSIFDKCYTQDGTKEFNKLFEDNNIYPFPKPTALLTHLLEIVNSLDSIVLDFFAGSSTTAHAVLEQNKEDGGNRKFIMVQLPEPCDEESEAYKAGYKTVADIGKERIRRVIKKIEEEQASDNADGQMKLPGSEEEKPLLDLGFKVFKLDRSNFRVWDGSNLDIPLDKLEEQLALQVDHIDPEAGQEEILFELLLKAGYMLTEKVERLEMAGKTVFSIAEGALLICLEDEITRELIDAVAGAEPVQFICLDRGFKDNDQLKANAVQTFNAFNQGREDEKEIVFRTV